VKPIHLASFVLVVTLGAGSPVAFAQGTIVPEVDKQQPATQQPATAQTATPTQPSAAPQATTTPAQTSQPAQGTTTEGAAAPAQSAPVATATATAPAPAVPAVPAQGQWVYTDQYGWIWVPEGSTTVYVQEQPYVYLYTPTYGWTWYGSPWGPGRYYYGPWVHHVWGAPRVWHRGGWYAPHVVVRPRVYVAPHVYRGGSYGHRGGHR
jgi:hypothetical protein